MKKIIRQIIRLIVGLFDRSAAKEAERVFELDSRVLAGKPSKGGGRLK